MSQNSVQDILQAIEQLSESDRDLLEQRLAERTELEWRREAEAARAKAEIQGIDQTAIDEAIHRRRYGT